MQPTDGTVVKPEAPSRVAVEVAGESPADLECRPKLPPPGGNWEVAMQALSGSLKTKGFPPQEIAAVVGWIAALEGEMPVVGAKERALLGTLGRVVLLEHRVFRLLCDRGLTTQRGEVKGLLAEFRTLAGLKASLLARLKVRKEPKPLDLGSYLQQARGDGGKRREGAQAPGPGAEGGTV
jgi:hypothetical protein